MTLREPLPARMGATYVVLHRTPGPVTGSVVETVCALFTDLDTGLPFSVLRFPPVLVAAPEPGQAM